MFKVIQNSPLDNREHCERRSEAMIELLIRDLLLAHNAQETVRNYYENAKKTADHVDKIFSQRLTGEDLYEYSGRMKYCVEMFKKMKSALEQADSGAPLNTMVCITAMSYLEGELKGLLYTA